MSMMDDKSVVNFNNLGPDDFIGGVYDDKGHRMKYIAKKVESDTDALFCNLCDDEIDMPLGYFTCALCKEDHCKACAMDRDKQETEMAENPHLVATPHSDILRDSYIAR